MSYYISDAFSLNMVTDYDLPCVSVTRVGDRYAESVIGSGNYCSAVRDGSVASAIGVERSDTCFTLQRGDDLLVAQP